MRDRPHLVDRRQKSKLERLLGNGFARLKPRSAHGEVRLNLVPVLRELLEDG